MAADVIRRSRRRKRVQPRNLNGASLVVFSICLFLAGLAPIFSASVYGASRIWSTAPFLLLSTFSVLLFSAWMCWTSEKIELRIPGAFWVWLAFVLYAVVRVPTAAVPREGLWSVLQLAGAGLTFLLFFYTSSLKGARAWLVLGVLLGVSLLCWYAIIMHLRGEAMVLWRPRPVQYGMRASSTYICPNHFAAHLAVAACLALAVLLGSSFGAGMKILAGYTLLLIFPALILTGSRSGFLGLIAGLALTAWVHMLRKSWRAAFLSALGMVVAGVATVAVLWYTVPSLQARIYGSMLSNPDPAVSGRLMIWADALRMFGDKPWFGFGPGSFRWVHPTYKEIFAQVRWRFAHNEYLHLLAEHGLVGAILMFTAGGWFMVWTLQQAVKTRDAFGAMMGAVMCGALGASLVHAVFDYNLHVFPVVQLLAMLAGLTAASLRNERAGAASLIGQRVLGAGGVVVALVVLLTTARVYAADICLRKGDDWAALLKRDKAQTYYQKALHFQPASDEVWLKIADGHRFKAFWDRDAEIRAEEIQKAFEAYDRTLQYNPYEFGALLAKGQLLCQQGQVEEGLALMREACESVPTQGPYAEQYGLQLRRLGRDAEAFEVFDRVLRKGVRTNTIRLNHTLLKKRLAARKAAE